MITVPRSLIRRFRALHRRARISKAPGPLGKHVIFRSGSDGLRLQAVSDQLALEYYQPGDFEADELIVPADLLASCEGRADEPVTLEAAPAERVRATWTDRGIPQIVEYDRLGSAAAKTLPDTPASLEPNTPELCGALSATLTIVSPERTRFALDCLKLCGRAGTITVTDGRQVLVQSGFHFPWTDDLLVQASPAIGSREFLREGPVATGKTDDWVALRVGPWTMWLRIEHEARFPKVDDLFRPPSAAAARLVIDPLDAKFLAGTLDRLGGDEAMNQPLTLDLNGEIAVRSRPAASAPPTELILSRSRLDGQPMAVTISREFLARAIKLGFCEVCLFAPQAPALCDDGRRQYLWALLDPESIVHASEDAMRVESTSFGTPNPTTQSKAHRRRLTVPRTTRRARIKAITNDPASSPFAQAVAVRTALRETLAQTNELIREIKRDKRRHRLVASTLASLKQLQKIAG